MEGQFSEDLPLFAVKRMSVAVVRRLTDRACRFPAETKGLPRTAAITQICGRKVEVPALCWMPFKGKRAVSKPEGLK